MANIELNTMVICYLRYIYCLLNVLKFNPSTAKRGGVKLTPEHIFAHYTDISTNKIK